MNSGYRSNLLLGFVSGFFYLFLVGSLGILMRSSNWMLLPIPYVNILHAHSHTALLGWAFVMATSGILYFFPFQWKWHKFFQIGLATSIIGMFSAFLYQSYAVISISFSTFFVVFSYFYLSRILKEIPNNNFSNGLLRRGIIYFYISTLGIWVLGPASAILGKSHWLYDSGIQFFLHFQINGWLLFVVLGLIFKNIPKIYHPQKNILKFLDLGLILGISMIILWISESIIIYVINIISILFIFIGFLPILKSLIRYIREVKPKFSYILYLLIFSLIGKLISHLFSLDLSFALKIENNRELVIAFIHLILIGIVSTGFIWIVAQIYSTKKFKIFNIGFLIFIIGFYITEFVLVLQGFGLRNLIFTVEILWIFSVFMYIGMIIMMISFIKSFKTKMILDYFKNLYL